MDSHLVRKVPVPSSLSNRNKSRLVGRRWHYKDDLQQVEVSKSDKAKPERLLSAKAMTRCCVGLGNIGWLVDHCCPQLYFHLSVWRRRQNDATIQDMLKLNKMIRFAKPIERKVKIRCQS